MSSEWQEWPIERVKPYDRNPRHNDDAVGPVAASLKEFGWQQPIVVDEDGVILAGHTRYKAAKRLGLETVPVHVARGLTPEQAQAYRLADNKTAEAATWNDALLAGELDGISTIDMEAFGFGESDANADGNGLDDKYSAKLGEVTYEPSERRWNAGELFDEPRRDEIVPLIEAVEDEDIRAVLYKRLDWLIEWHWDRVADYYCNQASPSEQRAFERLAMVLMDRDDLIANGYSDLMQMVDSGDWDE